MCQRIFWRGFSKMMRIVAGKHRGKALKAPEGLEIRPTSDKVRQAIFNVLSSQGRVQGCCVLDMFCGTGALGLEALSGGARHCAFLDWSPVSLAQAKENAAHLGEVDSCTFLKRDALQIGVRPEFLPVFDLVFLDPPYHKNLSNLALNGFSEGNWLKKGAFLVIETEKYAHLPIFPGFSFKIQAEKIYGLTKVTFLSYKTG